MQISRTSKSIFIVFFFLLSIQLFAQKEAEKITLLFVGDLMQHQGQIDAARTPSGYDYSDCFKYVQEEISKADIAIGNLEVTLAGKPYRGYPMFSAPDEYLYAIKDAGFDILLTANNHCLDRGQKGLERTILLLDSIGMPHLGTYINTNKRKANYPLLIEENGFKLVFLNYTYGTNGIKETFPNRVNYIDKDEMQSDIRQAREMRPDAIIACIHWGQEYKSLPDRSQKELADWLLSQGVTHIIGNHPHVLQPMELRKNTHSLDRNVVVYSLGNFISNMSNRGTDGGAILKMELSKRNNIVRVSSYKYGLIWVSRPAISSKKNYILYPVNGYEQELNSEENKRRNTFTKDSRELLRSHNIEIDEYIFE